MFNIHDCMGTFHVKDCRKLNQYTTLVLQTQSQKYFKKALWYNVNSDLRLGLSCPKVGNDLFLTLIWRTMFVKNCFWLCPCSCLCFYRGVLVGGKNSSS